MAILSTVIRVVAIIWVIAQLLTTRKRVRQVEIAVPPHCLRRHLFLSCLFSLPGSWAPPRCTCYGCFL